MRTHADDLVGPTRLPQVVLEGHFEDLTVIQASVVAGLPLPSRLRGHDNAKVGPASVGIHVRLGDYRTAWAALMLPREYYAEAIRYLRSQVDVSKIVVYSDEPEDARRFVLEASSRSLRVTVDTNARPVSVMMALAGHPYKIPSRSTFSWLSGIIGCGRELLTLSPDSKGMPTPGLGERTG